MTGLTTAQMRSSIHPEFPEAYAAFLDFIAAEVAGSGSDAVPLLIGHNIFRYDVPLLINRASEAGLSLPVEARVLDTYVMAKAIMPALKSYRLSSLVHHFTGKHPEQAHRAAADVETNELVLHALLRHAEGGAPVSFDAETLGAYIQKETVGDVHARIISGNNKPPSAGKPASPRAKRQSSELSAGEFGRSVAAASAAPVEAPLPLSSVDESAEESSGEICWAEDDPLAAISGEDVAAAAFPMSKDEFASARSSWRDLASDMEATRCYLTQPIENCRARVPFTKKQVK